MTDDKGNAWALAASVNNGSVTSAVYVAQNVGVIDAISTNSTSSSPAVNAGSLTTNTVDDLVYNYGYDQANATLQPGGTLNISGFTACGCGFLFLSVDVFVGDFAQYAVQANPGPVTPGITVNGGADGFNSVAWLLRQPVKVRHQDQGFVLSTLERFR